MFLFAAKKEPKNRRRFRRGGRTTKGPAGPLESLRLAPGDPVRLGQGNARLAVQAHAPETPVFRPPIENGEQRFPIPLRGRLLQASIRPELPEAGKGLSMLPFMCGHIQCRHAFRCFSFFAQWLSFPPLGLPEFCTFAAQGVEKQSAEKCRPHKEETTIVKLLRCVKAPPARDKNHLRKATEPETSHLTPMAQTFLRPARFRSQEALRK